MQIHDPPRRKHAVFLGAGFLAGGIPKQDWTSKAEYKERGPEATLWAN